MENLISALSSELCKPCADPMVSDPMTPDWISIQSRGMKQWISIQLANKLGISANIKFLFPRQVIDIVLDSMVPKNIEAKQFNQDHLYWLAMKLIQSEKSNRSFSSIEDYFKDDATGKKQSQLCLKIAGLFDD